MRPPKPNLAAAPLMHLSFAAVDHLIAGGAILALGSVALLQYLHHVGRMTQARTRREHAEVERQTAEDQLADSRREHALTRLENQVLREFISQTRPEQAIDLLLRRFVPQSERGFAALIERTEAGTICEFNRGLSEESLASLRLSDAELAVVHQARLVTLEGLDVDDSSIVACLSPRDAAKAERLHLVAIGDRSEPVGVFATTSLYPPGAPLVQQIELAKRLTANLASGLRLVRALKAGEAQLRLTSEMLELRAIADRRFNSPLGLIEAFLAAVRTKVAAEGAALFLTTREGQTGGAAVARCGGPAAAGPSGRWRRSEEALGRLAIARDRPRLLGPDELPRYGVAPVIRTALLLPLCREGTPIGMICLSRGEAAPFTAVEQSLASWAAEFLAQAIPRVLNQAVVERQARQDSLTGLANRRAFEVHLAAAMDHARETSGEVSLLLCDIDRFKTVNDTYGHRAGDEVLRAVARVLQDEVLRLRSSDWALTARYGGEELAVLLPAFTATGSLRVAEGIRARVEQMAVPVDGRTLQVTISIGMAAFPQHCDAAEDLLTRADAALYQAKSEGRNRVCSAGEGTGSKRPAKALAR
jgi:diguanylate cyclase (GGDEF)-like protein